ncbi:MAG: hypothetical protein FJ098_01700 [Deltaproteobacteria bacterium]|nr:hypothetical protein [Deltaproteobacteria bacterium]
MAQPVADWKEAVKTCLRRIGEAFRPSTEGAPRVFVLRFHSPVDRERGMDVVRRAFPRVPWEALDLGNDRSGTRVHRLLTDVNRNRSLMLWGLPGEPRELSDEFLSSLEIGVQEGGRHRILLCVLAGTVKHLANRTPELWKGKVGYRAWPLQPGITEAALGFETTGEGEDSAGAPPVDAKETRQLLGRLQNVDSAEYLVKVARANMARGEMENARLLLLRSVEIFYANSDIEGLARTYHLLGEVASVAADIHAALEWIQQALENWRVADNPRGLSDTLTFKGYLHYQVDQLEPALRAFEESMALDEGLGDTLRLAAGFRRMAMVFEKNMELPRARGLYERSLELEQERDNAEGIARVYHHLGRLAELDQAWDEAEGRYRSSLKLKQDLNDVAGMAATHHQLGNLFFKKKAFPEAAESYREAERLEVRCGDGEGRARTLAQLGLVLVETGALEEALSTLVLAYNLLQKLRSPIASELLNRIEELQERLPAEVFNRIVRSRGTEAAASGEPVDKRDGTV